ncbi:hypothetical protein AERO9A_250215 [Aeromonas salmonicida]|nr:hypothetical protein AERO9A_250215 [Aeromonas salmonicida]
MQSHAPFFVEPRSNQLGRNEVREWVKLSSIAGVKEVESLFDTRKKFETKSTGFGFLHIRRIG